VQLDIRKSFGSPNDQPICGNNNATMVFKNKRELSFMNYIGENPNRHHAPRTTDLEVILYLAYTGIF